MSLSSSSGLLPTSTSCVQKRPRVFVPGVITASPISSKLEQKTSAPIAGDDATSIQYSRVTPPWRPDLGGGGAIATRPMGVQKLYIRSSPASFFGTSLFCRPRQITLITSVTSRSAEGSMWCSLGSTWCIRGARCRPPRTAGDNRSACPQAASTSASASVSRPITGTQLGRRAP